MQPRYQVFVSSTFRDLREKRQAALEAILELGHFPAGMEAFPAADATPWELIRSIISDSDYYVLIVGGRYGSTGPEGISYTEMEFNLAVELKKPILAFLHSAPDQIPVGKAELNTDARKQLEEFRTKVSERLCKGWKSKDELKSAVLLGLIHLIRTKPAFGWVRNEGLQNHELLQRLATLQSRYDELQSEAVELREIASKQLESGSLRKLEEPSDLAFRVGSHTEQFTSKVSWLDLFYLLADKMLVPATEDDLLVTFETFVFESLRHDANVRGQSQIHLANKKLFDDILRLFMAHGLIAPQLVHMQQTSFGKTTGKSERCWALTEIGNRKYLEKRTLR